MEPELHPDAHEEGGLALNDKQLMAEQREAILEWMKAVGKKLLYGNLNLISTSFPVRMFEPRSYLEKLADVWVYPDFLARAAAAMSPVERLQHVVTWFVAGIHHSFERWKKPFNPILGETWQASLSDGTQIFIEQISHHPPVSAVVMEGPGASYKFVGFSQPSVSPVVKVYGFKTVAKGHRYIDFPDGTRIGLHYPAYLIKGVVYATKPRAELTGIARFVDESHGLEAVVKFGPVKDAKQRLLLRSDSISGGIYSSKPGVLAKKQQQQQQQQQQQRRPESAGGKPPPLESRSQPVTRQQQHALQANSTEDETTRRQLEQLELVVGGRATPDPSAFSSSDDESGTPNVAQPSGGSGSSSARPTHSSTSAAPAATSSSSSSWGGWLYSYAYAEEEYKPAGNLTASIRGCWLSHLDIDGHRQWTLRGCRPDTWRPSDHPLPSDCRFREDLAWLKRGDVVKAQEWKEILEQRQRADKKERGDAHGH